MGNLRFAAFGAGFWTRFQLSGWREIPGVQCVAIYNRTPEKAQACACEFEIPAVYSDPELLLRNEKLDFVDVITGPDTHEHFALLALLHGLPVICQKPLAPTLAAAARMVQAFEKENLPLLVNENWRWQTPIRKVKEVLDTAPIGRPFRARIDLISGFPVFRNQPFLKDLHQFILTDLGPHILDVCRFLFGEARTVYCKTSKVHAEIAGEDVATVVLEMQGGVTVLAEMAYAENYLEDECFPQTRIFIEAERGSLELKSDYRIHLTTREGTSRFFAPPVHFPWADHAYDVVHSSIVPCQRNLADALRGVATAETTGEDNLRTVRLVFAAYESAHSGTPITP